MAEQHNRRYTDRDDGQSRQRISSLAFLLAGLLIAVTSVSLLFVGYIATQASDEQAIRNERRLFHTTLADRERLIVREMAAIARWDMSVEKIVLDFDYEFVREHVGSLWLNHGHNRSLVVSGEGRILAETFRDYTHISNRSLSETPELMNLLEQAQTLYSQNRVRVPGGYSYRSIQSLAPSEFAAISFVEIDGKIALAAAMPIIPDHETVRLPDGEPTILISAKFVDEPFLRDLNAQLSFKEMAFSRTVTEIQDGPGHLVNNIKGESLGAFVWVSETRGDTIWPTVVPVILLLSLALAALAFGIAWRIGKLTTSLQASERQNRYLALHDTLSGLANRLQFNRVLASSVKNLPAKPFAVIHCDLDEFKAVNDTHGHAAGDEVIKTVAKRMKEVVGRGGLVSRLGGDEFVILMRTITDRKGLRELSNQLIASIAQPIEFAEGAEAEVGLSIGISLAPDQGADGEALVAAADAALYYSKQHGRGRMVFSSDLPALAKSELDESVPEPAIAAGAASSI
ncbi:diguanylate cyclase [uncultured Roseibium sp.]|uniref:sensor domain-containing diguanylate cyclase n=1 Tax=uncultured Roseibium sp. TaxID=1936171 RepID=UPI0025953A3E|nr:diguanylate cyclase [uncultured Roseibium sp.]